MDDIAQRLTDMFNTIATKRPSSLPVVDEVANEILLAVRCDLDPADARRAAVAVVDLLTGESSRYRCGECGWIGGQKDVLTGQHPFIEDDRLMGCPKCQQIAIYMNIRDQGD